MKACGVLSAEQRVRRSPAPSHRQTLPSHGVARYDADAEADADKQRAQEDPPTRLLLKPYPGARNEALVQRAFLVDGDPAPAGCSARATAQGFYARCQITSVSDAPFDAAVTALANAVTCE